MQFSPQLVQKITNQLADYIQKQPSPHSYLNQTMITYNNKIYLIHQSLNKKKELTISLLQIKSDEYIHKQQLYDKDFKDFAHNYNIKLIDCGKQVKIKNVNNIKLNIVAHPNNNGYCYISLQIYQDIDLFIFNLDEQIANQETIQLKAHKIRIRNGKILKIEWYPFSQFHVCILLSSQKLCFYACSDDLDSPELMMELNEFNACDKYIDFKFKICQNEDLSMFTLFLLSDNEQIFGIQPIILRGTTIKKVKFNKIKRRLLNSEFGLNYQTLYKTFQNKIKGVKTQQFGESIIFDVDDKISQYYFTSYINQNVFNESQKQQIRFQIAQGTKFCVFLIQKQYNNNSCHSIQTIIYPNQVVLCEKKSQNIFTICELNFQIQLPQKFLQQNSLTNSYPILLNTRPSENKFFVLSFNQIYTFNISGIRELENDFSFKGLTQSAFQLKKFYSIPVDTTGKICDNVPYGILLHQQNIFMVTLIKDPQFSVHRVQALFNATKYQNLTKSVQDYIKNLKQEIQLVCSQEQQKKDRKIIQEMKKFEFDRLQKMLCKLNQDCMTQIQKKIYEVEDCFKQLKHLKEQKEKIFQFGKLQNRINQIRVHNQQIRERLQKNINTSNITNNQLKAQIKKFQNEQKLIKSSRSKMNCIKINPNESQTNRIMKLLQQLKQQKLRLLDIDLIQ